MTGPRREHDQICDDLAALLVSQSRERETAAKPAMDLAFTALMNRVRVLASQSALVRNELRDQVEALRQSKPRGNPNEQSKASGGGW